MCRIGLSMNPISGYGSLGLVYTRNIVTEHRSIRATEAENDGLRAWRTSLAWPV